MEQVNIQAKIPVSILREGNKFVAYSPALDLSTSADSHEDVKRRFAEIIDIFFEETLKKGTLNTVLADLGWKKMKSNWVPPILISQEYQTVSLATN